jgi:hypothetical protein
VEKNPKINRGLKFTVDPFKSLHWQGFQPIALKHAAGVAFSVFCIALVSGSYDGKVRIILVPRGLERSEAGFKKN